MNKNDFSIDKVVMKCLLYFMWLFTEAVDVAGFYLKKIKIIKFHKMFGSDVMRTYF